MIKLFFILLLSAIASLISVNWIFFKILNIAKRKELVDKPNNRKLQKSPVPVLGGLVVMFGLLVGLLVYMTVCKIMELSTITQNSTTLLPVLLCCNVMLYVGTMDDILGLSVKSRLFIEVLTLLGLIYGSGLCVDSLHGLWGIESFSWWIAVPLTVFAGVGIINSYNMVDGVNGLSSGLCIMCSIILGVICFNNTDFAKSALAFCFAGSLIPFLIHNVFGKQSKMFIGDGGTMMMGMLVNWFMIMILSSENADLLKLLANSDCELGLVAMMLAVASVPVFDTIRVMTARIIRHQSPFKPDRTHLHHVFIDVGVSHSITALCEIIINMLIYVIWYVTYRLGARVDVQLYIVVLSAMLLIWGVFFYLSSVRKKNNSSICRWAKTTHLGHTNWWLFLQRHLDRGALDDFSVLLNKRIENMNYKERDITAMMNYLQGRTVVSVEEIIAEAGVEEPRVVCPILFDLEQAGFIVVLERADLGVPKLLEIKL